MILGAKPALHGGLRTPPRLRGRTPASTSTRATISSSAELPPFSGAARTGSMSASSKHPLPSEAEVAELAADAVVWASQHGLVVGLAGPQGTPAAALVHAPLAALPVCYPRSRFLLAKQVMPLFNELIDAVARDEAYLEATLRAAAAHDPFTAALLDVLAATRPDRARHACRQVTLGIHRSDYMLDAPSNTFLQVELNTIAASFGCLSAITTRLHRHMLSLPAARGTGLSAANLPDNPAIDGIPAAIAAAARAYADAHGGGSGAAGSSPPSSSTDAQQQQQQQQKKKKHGVVVVMVVQPGERNAYDQQWIAHQLWAQHGLRTLRRTLAEIDSQATLNDADGRVTLGGPAGPEEVAVFYFRAGYSPADYPTDAEWRARSLMERSSAVCCPSVAYQLAGTKKVQQDLARPGVLERFVRPSSSSSSSSMQADDAAAALRLRSFFAGLWGLDDLNDPETAAVVARALAQPEAFVLKPQREGGGNNLYGFELQAALRSGGSGLSAYILMQRILPPLNRSILVRNGQHCIEDTLSELGIYGTYVRAAPGPHTPPPAPSSPSSLSSSSSAAAAAAVLPGGEVLLNAEVGHLVRTKTASSNEGGVAAGFAVLDSPHLMDD